MTWFLFSVVSPYIFHKFFQSFDNLTTFSLTSVKVSALKFLDDAKLSTLD